MIKRIDDEEKELFTEEEDLCGTLKRKEKTPEEIDRLIGD